MKGKGECIFGSVAGRMSGVVNGRAMEGAALLLSKRVLEEVVEYREVSARFIWVKVKFGGESWLCLLVHTVRGVRGVRKQGRLFEVY